MMPATVKGLLVTLVVTGGLLFGLRFLPGVDARQEPPSTPAQAAPLPQPPVPVPPTAPRLLLTAPWPQKGSCGSLPPNWNPYDWRTYDWTAYNACERARKQARDAEIAREAAEYARQQTPPGGWPTPRPRVWSPRPIGPYPALPGDPNDRDHDGLACEYGCKN